METDVRPPGGGSAETIKTALKTDRFWSRATGSARSVRVVLFALPVLAGVTWMLLPGPSDAENPFHSAPTPALLTAQETSLLNPEITPTEAPAPALAEVTRPSETSPVDGLKISSQSWRRGGLGSRALVTFTLRNGNEYAVRDIEIFCAFTRKDGSHLTDRKRLIHDTVNMKSQRTFSRLHVGFVNVNADQAKCSLVAAARL